eukprot:6478496-Amphidinium_carterae.1
MDMTTTSNTDGQTVYLRTRTTRQVRQRSISYASSNRTVRTSNTPWRKLQRPTGKSKTRPWPSTYLNECSIGNQLEEIRLSYHTRQNDTAMRLIVT